jgi:hypothetical protein
VDLARTGRFSPFHFHRLFREVTTLTPARFLATLRMAEARRLLLHSGLTVTEISNRVGYASGTTFTTQFRRLVGAAPEQFRKLARVLADQPVGCLLSTIDSVGAPERRDGVWVVAQGAGANDLVVVGLRATDCAREFPDTWTVAAGREPARLAAAPRPGRYRARVLVVGARTAPTTALVDQAPDSYVTGTAEIRLPAETQPARPVTVTLRQPQPTDPPFLSVAPLRWLVDLAGRLDLRPERRSYPRLGRARSARTLPSAS